MATNNVINLNQSGLCVYDGAGTFLGRSLISGNSGITITNPDGIAGNPTINLVNFIVWVDVTGTTQSMSTFNSYIADNASLVTFTLPSTANLGDVIFVYGKGAGGWKINQNALQQVTVGKLSSTSGVSGSVASTNQFDTIELRCITSGTSTVWTAKVTGNITVV